MLFRGHPTLQSRLGPGPALLVGESEVGRVLGPGQRDPYPPRSCPRPRVLDFFAWAQVQVGALGPSPESSAEAEDWLNAAQGFLRAVSHQNSGPCWAHRHHTRSDGSPLPTARRCVPAGSVGLKQEPGAWNGKTLNTGGGDANPEGTGGCGRFSLSLRPPPSTWMVA